MKTFKSLLCILFMMYSITSSAQDQDIIISLPHYKQGQHECDTIYKHYGGTGGNQKGTIAFAGDLTNSLMTGVKFYFLVDSIEPGGASLPSAFVDSIGIRVPMRKGGKYEIPTKIEIYGKIRYYIIIEGTPLVGNESYYCTLTMKVPGIQNNLTQNIKIQNTAPYLCTVDPIQSVETMRDKVQLNAYPNPVMDKMTIQVNKEFLPSEYLILDGSGKTISNGMLINSITTLNMSTLPNGNYFIQIGKSSKGVFKIIKK